MGKSEGTRPLEDHDVNGRIILKWILEIGCGAMDWTDLT
jgi:hypothetical protein